MAIGPSGLLSVRPPRGLALGGKELSMSAVAETKLGEATLTLDSHSADFALDGVRFRVLEAVNHKSRTTDSEGVALLKDRQFFKTELDVVRSIGEVSRMFELGVWQGGSAALWALTMRLTRYVGLACGVIPA
jgi:hypothetical protein